MVEMMVTEDWPIGWGGELNEWSTWCEPETAEQTRRLVELFGFDLKRNGGVVCGSLLPMYYPVGRAN